MNNFIEYVLNQPIALIVFSTIVLIIVYFIVKKLLKLALLFGLILIALCGYYYCNAPGEFPENVKSKIHDMKNQTGEVLEKGRDVYRKGREMAEEVADMAEKRSKSNK
ncbi:MAG: hypothetical protein U9R24_03325 [Thermodesulfobacteriota bacterium]|nr:hypothetical protein [Thermodesulfobacteriota bacterium]